MPNRRQCLLTSEDHTDGNGRTHGDGVAGAVAAVVVLHIVNKLSYSRIDSTLTPAELPLPASLPLPAESPLPAEFPLPEPIIMSVVVR